MLLFSPKRIWLKKPKPTNSQTPTFLKYTPIQLFCNRHPEVKERITVLWISTSDRNNSWLRKWRLLYFQGTKFALTHRYSAAADQIEEKKKKRKKRIICFSQTCIWKHQAFYLPGQMTKAYWSAYTSLDLFEDRELHQTSPSPPSFSEWQQILLDCQTSPFWSPSLNAMMITKLQKRKKKKRGVWGRF